MILGAVETQDCRGAEVGASHEQACQRMAQVAQDSYDQARKALGKDATDAQILAEFDKIFSNYYIGRPLDGVVAAASLYWRGPVGRLVANDPNVNEMLGQGGLKDGFLENDNVASDQTHHFAAYFSGGINGMALTVVIHELGDHERDAALGNAAFEIGWLLRFNPAELKNIGKMIREKICK